MTDTSSIDAVLTAEEPLILSLPPEVLFDVLLHLDPVDVASFSLTSQAAHSFCHPHPHLWHRLFLTLFDSPSPSPATSSTPSDNHLDLLKPRIHARGLIQRIQSSSDQLAAIFSNQESLLPTFLTIATQARSPTSPNVTYLSTLFPPFATRTTTEYLSRIDHISSTPPLPPTTIAPQAARDVAHFKVLHGAIWNTQPTIVRAIKRVYNLRFYTASNLFGLYLPPSPDSSVDEPLEVDWIGVDAVRTIMVDNLRDAIDSESWGGTVDYPTLLIPGQLGWSEAVRGGVGEQIGRDWAGVERQWIGTYLFLDWQVFEMMNGPQPVRHITLAEYRRQGIGEVMSLDLKLLPPRSSSNTSDPNPPLDFAGTLTTRDAPPGYPTLTITGTVSRLSPSAIRWQFRVSHAGSPRWALEGVQVGGERSKMGIVGVWTHAGPTPGEEDVGRGDGPCGPFWWFVDPRSVED